MLLNITNSNIPMYPSPSLRNKCLQMCCCMDPSKPVS